MITKPMLAVACDIDALIYPILCTEKLDGIRCLRLNGKSLSRNFKEIPNIRVRDIMKDLPDGLDGELILTDPNSTFNDVQSQIMSEDGEPDFRYCIFDYVTLLSEPYFDRMNKLQKMVLPKYCNKILPHTIKDQEQLHTFEKGCIEAGYEGVMIRKPDGPYKCGRSTLRESYLLKLKRFQDSEAEIIGFEELMHNENEATKDELGRTKRSSHKENLVPAGKLGTLKVKDIKSGIEFGIGSGFDDLQKQEIWNNRTNYLGKVVTYKFQTIEKDKPRFPVWKGFRHQNDIGYEK